MLHKSWSGKGCTYIFPKNPGSIWNLRTTSVSRSVFTHGLPYLYRLSVRVSIFLQSSTHAPSLQSLTPTWTVTCPLCGVSQVWTVENSNPNEKMRGSPKKGHMKENFRDEYLRFKPFARHTGSKSIRAVTAVWRIKVSRYQSRISPVCFFYPWKEQRNDEKVSRHLHKHTHTLYSIATLLLRVHPLNGVRINSARCDVIFQIAPLSRGTDKRWFPTTFLPLLYAASFRFSRIQTCWACSNKRPHLHESWKLRGTHGLREQGI